jgi:hypothetical protein
MSAQNITRRKPTTVARTLRRTVPAPRFTRIEGNLKVVVPPDCDASVILKQVVDGERRYYVLWLLVGRTGQKTMTVSYKHAGETAFRCDLPSGMPVSAAALQPHLAKFLKINGSLQDKPPIIK